MAASTERASVAQKSDKDEGTGEAGREAADLSPSELEDSAVATEQTRENSEVFVNPNSDDASIWPDESAETAFLAEQKSQGSATSLPFVDPEVPEQKEEREDATTPLPPLDELINRVPAHAREVLEDLFRAKFVRVVRTKKHLLK